MMLRHHARMDDKTQGERRGATTSETGTIITYPVVSGVKIWDRQLVRAVLVVL